MFKDFGILLILLGVVLFIMGVFLLLIGHTGFRMPLDIVIRGKNFAVYIPIGTSILLSILLTVLLSMLFRSK